MPAGAISLTDYPREFVALACSKCERSCHYRKTSLIAIHGAEIGLPDLRARLASGCARMRNAFGNDPCGVHYPDLAKAT